MTDYCSRAAQWLRRQYRAVLLRNRGAGVAVGEARRCGGAARRGAWGTLEALEPRVLLNGIPGGPGGPGAPGHFAISDATDEFGTIDPSTGAFTAIDVVHRRFGTTVYEEVENLAVDPVGGMVFAMDNGTFLLEIDPLTGGALIVGAPDVTDIDALTFDPQTGELYAIDAMPATNPGELVRIDRATGEVAERLQLIAPDPNPFDDPAQADFGAIDPKVDGIAFDPATGVLYGAYSSWGDPSWLVTIDLNTGQLTIVGAAGVDDIEDITFGPDGVLYGVLGDTGAIGAGARGSYEGLVTIDTQTGAATGVGLFGDPGAVGRWDMEGLAFSLMSDVDPSPNITLQLSNDTGRPDAPFTATDRLTSDPSVTGAITDNGTITAVRATMNGGPLVDITGDPAVNPDFTFSFDRAFYESVLLGGPMADGDYTLAIEADDDSGNPRSAQLTFTLDTTPPVVGSPDMTPGSDTGVSDTDDLTADATPDFTVDTESDALVTLRVDGMDTGSTTAGPLYTFNNVGPLGEGPHDITAAATDLAGNTGVSAALPITIDLTPPAVDTPDLQAASDSGASDIDDITNIASPLIDVAAEDGATVRLLVDGVEVATGVAAGGQVTFNPMLTEGVHQIIATAADAAGNVNTSDPLTVTVDLTPPNIDTPDLVAASDTGRSDTDDVTNDNTPTIEVIALPGSAVTLRVDGGVLGTTTADGAGVAMFTLTTPLSDGDHTFDATAEDVAGNVGTSGVLTVTIDTTPPVVGPPDLQASSDSGDSDTDDLTNDDTPTFDIDTESNAIVTLFVDGAQRGRSASGPAYTITATPPLADGPRTVHATAEDVAGNIGTSADLSITIDTTPPAVQTPDLQASSDSGVSDTDNITNINTPMIDVAAEDGSAVTLTVGGADVGTMTATGGVATFTLAAPLSDGDHVLSAAARDAAGNIGASGELTITIDTSPPVVDVPDLQASSDSGDSDTDNLTNVNSPLVDVTVDDAAAAVTLRVDGVDAGGSDTPPHTFALSNLTEGDRTLDAAAQDIAGNIGTSPGLVITIDLTPPPLSLQLDPASDTAPAGDNATTLDAVTLTGATEANRGVTLFRDGDIFNPVATTTADAAGDYTFTNIALSPGANPFTTHAFDAAGNFASADLTVTRIEGEAPVITAALDSDTGRADRPDTATDRLTSDPTVSGSIIDTNAIIAVRAALNSGPLIDITADPAINPDFTFTFGRAFYEATLLGGANMADGDYTLSIEAEDEFNNISPLFTLTFTLDTTPPVVGAPDMTAASDSGDSDTDDLTNDTTPTFTIDTESDALVTLRIDGINRGQTTIGPPFTITTDTPLADGAHTANAAATDLAGNTGASPDLSITIDTTPPVVDTPDLQAASDSGVSDTDNLTNDNTPTFDVIAEDGSLVRLFVDGGEADSAIATGGIATFTLTAPLSDGDHQISATAEDAAGNIGNSGDLTITIDTTPPPLSLALDPASDTDPPGDNSTTLDSVSLIGATEPGLTVTLFASDDPATPLATAAADAAGDYRFDGAALAIGDNAFTATTMDAAGNTTSEDLTVTREEDDLVTLIEETNFNVVFQQPITVPDEPSTLSFTFENLFFDEDDDFINDAFEAALVGIDGLPLVQTIVGSRDAFFNITEGHAAEAGVNTQIDGQTVRVDLTHIPAGTAATLIVRLVNNDADTTTSVTITDVQVTPGSLGTPLGAPSSEAASPDAPAIDFAALSDITPSVAALYGQTSFNEETATLFADLGLANIGTYDAGRPLVAVVTNITDPGVVVLNADGVTPQGDPYFDFTGFLTDGVFGLGDATGQRTLRFFNPSGNQFGYELRVLGQLNRAPQFISQADTEVLADHGYVYQAEAVDPDGDVLEYTLSVSPPDMTIDAATGLIQWSPTVDDVGNHSVVVSAADGRGGVAEQSYTLNVIDDIANRPPVITSLPPVGAAVNVLYEYQVTATDPDDDTLTFSLLTAPTGMTIDAATGVIEWTPGGDQLGDHVVDLEVSDGRGGIATQRYPMRVSTEPGNAPPVIVSDPATFFNLPGLTNPATGEVSPLSINLDLDAAQVGMEKVALTLSDSGNLFADIVFVVDESESMGGEHDWIEDMVLDLDAALQAAGVGPNRYSIVGYGGQNEHIEAHFHNLNDGSSFFLYDPDNRELDSTAIQSSLPEILVDATLTRDGSYILAIAGNEVGDPITYGFRVVTPTLETTPLVLNARTEGSLDVPGDIREYTFTLDDVSDLYFDPVVENHRIVWSLTGPSGVVINERPFHPFQGATARFADLELFGLPAGDYTLAISGPDGDTGPYYFDMSDLANVTEVTPDVPADGHLATRSETELFRFTTATPGERYYFDLQAFTTNATTFEFDPDLHWRLFDPYGNVLFDRDLQFGVSTDASDIDTFALPHAGQYVLAFEGSTHGRASGTADITFNVQPAPTSTEPMTLGQTVSSQIDHPGDEDQFTFSVAENTTIYFDSFTGNQFINWTLDGPRGTYVNSRRIDQSIASTTPNIFRIHAGDYTLTLDAVGDETGPYEFRIADFADAAPITPGTQVDGQLSPAGETDLYRFDVVGGQEFFFDSVSLTGPLPNWQLIDPFGSKALNGQRFIDDFDSVTLPRTGAYTLLIEGFISSSGTSNYSFNIQPIEPVSTALTVGSIVNGELTLPGERDVYTFSLAENTALYIDSLTNNNNLTWSLAGPGGPVINDRPFGTFENGTGLPFVRGGDYTLTIDGAGDTTTPYAFRVMNLASATPITPGTPVNGELDPSNETDMYKFTAAAGDEFLFDFIGGTVDFGVRWRLISPFRNTIFSSSVTTDSGPHQLTQPGDYTLLIEAPPFRVGVDTYEFNVIHQGNTPPQPFVGTPMTIGDTVSGELLTTGQEDVYTFTLTDPAVLYFDSFTNSAMGWTLQGPAGTYINRRQFNQSDAQGVLNLTAGDYAITVVSQFSQTGPYAFRLQDLAAATPITPGTDISGDLTPANENDLYQFNATAGDRVYFDILDQTGPQPILRILDPFNRVVISQFFSSDVDTMTLDFTGTYTVVVEGRFFQTGDSTYAFNIRPVAPSTQPLVLNSTVSGDISVPGESDRYTFSLPAGGRLHFDSLTNRSDIRWFLSGPSGTIVNNREFNRSDYGNVSTPIMSLHPGDYTLTVDGFNDATGEYAFRLWDVESIPASIPGGAVSGVLDPAAETDIYRFDAAAGDRFYFDTIAITGSNSSSWHLIDPFGDRVFLNGFSSPQFGDVDTMTLEHTGTYTLLLEGSPFVAATTNYIFAVEPIPIVTQPLTFGEQVDGTIDTPGVNPSYTFTLSDYSFLYFDSLTARGDLRWTIRGPSGTAISQFPFNDFNNADRMVPVNAGSGVGLPPGEYTLTVDGLRDAAGDFSFRLWNLTDGANIPMLTPGVPVAGDIAPAIESDLYQFDAAAGDMYFFDTEANTFGASTNWTLIDPYGNSLFTADLGTDVDTLTIEKPGRYTLIAYSRIGNPTEVSYTLNVQPVSAAEQPLPLGSVVNGQITVPGETDEYTFTLDETTSFYFDALTNRSDILWRVTRSTGTVRNPVTFASTDTSAFFTLAAGQYQLVIDGAGDATGDYAFRMTDLAAATLLTPGTAVSGSLSPANETDLYQFEATAGDRFFFDVEQWTGTNLSKWRLISPEIFELFSAPLTAADVGTLGLVSTGVYTLVLEGRIDNTAEGDYTFNVHAIEPQVSPLALGGTVSGTLAHAGAEHAYAFSVGVPTAVYMDVLTNEPSLAWTLAGPAGVVINSRAFAQASDGRYFSDLARYLIPGNYTLTIHASDDFTGDYAFRVHDLADVAALTPGTPISASLSPGAETDLYQFNVTPGDTFLFDLVSQASMDGARWRLIGPYANTVFSENFSADVGPLQLAQPGQHTLVIEGNVRDATDGDYTVDVQFQGNSPLPPIDATPLTLGAPVNDSIAVAGEVDHYTFSLATNSLVSFDALTVSGEFNLRWTLSGPAGTVINQRSFHTSDSTDISTSVLNLLAGDYVLSVNATGVNTPDYAFTLHDLASAQPITPGAPVSGSLNPTRETDLFNFQAQAGDLFFYDYQEGQGNARWRLIDPFGNVAVQDNFQTEADPVTLAHTGTYTFLLEASRFNINVTDYTFELLLNATPLTLGAQVFESVPTRREYDFYTFEGAAGQRLYYDSLGGDNNIHAELTSPTGRTVFTTPTSRNFGPITLRETGTYILEVNRDGSGNFANDYGFSLIDADAAPLISLSQGVEGVLDPTLETDLVRFEGDEGQRFLVVPGNGLIAGSAAQASLAARTLQAVGSVEDGYVTSRFALDHDYFRPGAAVNFMIVSDEDRDIIDFNYNFEEIFSDLDSRDIVLNVVARATLEDENGDRVLGVASDGTAYLADGEGGFTTTAGGVFVSGYGTTKQDYVDLAWALGGGAFDLNLLRSGGDTATSFTEAFVDFKLNEILNQFGIEVIPSDPAAPVVNTTGVVTGLGGGETAMFDLEFTGDGAAHSFDLQFVRAGTGILLGSIPVTINTNYFYPVRAIDPDGDVITYSLLQSPDGATIDPVTGRIDWDPSAPGVYPFIVAADDGRGGIDTQAYAVTVTAGQPNDPPVITSAPPTDATEGLPFAYTITAQDPNGDALSYFLIGPPNGMTIDRQEGTITWTPDLSQVGTHQITVRVQDTRGGSDEQMFDLTVGEDVENLPPQIISAPPAAIIAGDPLRYDAEAVDPNADPITFDLVVHPRGMVIDAQTGQVGWNPTEADVGAHDVFVRVRDGRGGVDLQRFELIVISANTAPVITSAPGAPAAVDRSYAYRVLAQDAENQALTFRLDEAPTGMFIDAATGALFWTPILSQLGDHNVTVTVADSDGAETSQSFVLPVVFGGANDAPFIDSTPRDTIALGSTYFYAPSASDPNHDALSFSLPAAPVGMTINDAGVIVWTPAADQLGINPVELRVEDGRGGFDVQAFNIEVTARGFNQPPVIQSRPVLNATVDEPYAYDVTGADPENDPVLWTLEEAPDGMSINPRYGTIRWTPNILQVGEHDVVVRALDLQGADAAQSFTVLVRAENVPPLITTTPDIDAFTGQRYTYDVDATDLERDPLTYSLDFGPAGMTIDPQTGFIEWIPPVPGNADVRVRVEDDQGGVATQEFRLLIHLTGINRAPRISSLPELRTIAGVLYEYQLIATDPEEQALTYSFGEELSDFEVGHPAGMTLDTDTGFVQWIPTPAQVGRHNVTLVVTDPGGSHGIQIFPIIVFPSDTALTLTSLPVTEVTAGEMYRYDVQAQDADGAFISYELLTAPAGMRIDGAGRITWQTGIADIGVHPIELEVGNDRGLEIIQSFDLSVLADTEAPMISLSVSTGSAEIGDDVTFIVRATDNVGVDALTLMFNGVALPLDDRGRSTVTVTEAGTFDANAAAADAAGNLVTAEESVQVTDPTDVEAPVVRLDAPADALNVTRPIDLTGLVQDDNLLFYTLEYALAEGGAFTEFFRSDQAVADGGVVGAFDPTLIHNDSYTIRLTAVDAGDNRSSDQVRVDVGGSLKLGNYQLTFTDLTVAIAGVPIVVTRSYDTREASVGGEVGFGWRLDLLNTDLRTSVRRTFSEEVGVFNPFRDGTKVYVTLPDGQRAGFTFTPEVSTEVLKGTFGFVDFIFSATFTPDPGVFATLEVPTVYLVRNGGQYFIFGPSGVPYNPADTIHGGTYTLTNKHGVAFQLDARDGRIQRIETPNGDFLDVTRNGLISPDGPQVLFERDPQGRITGIIDPAGLRIGYAYDAAGDLAAVTDRAGATTQFIYDADQPHYLTEIIDDNGDPVTRTEYDEQGRMIKVFDGEDNFSEFIYDLDDNQQTIFDGNGNPTLYTFDDRGNILEALDAGGGLTVFTVDEDDNTTSITNPLGHKIEFTFDDNGNVTSSTDPLGRVSYTSYNDESEPLTSVDPAGFVESYTYDDAGNGLSKTSADGSTISFGYAGNLVNRLELPDGSVNEAEYDGGNRVIRRVEPGGTIVELTWDDNRRRASDTVYRTIDGAQRPVTTRYEYDGEGRRTAIIYDDDTPGNPNDNPRTVTEYNGRGQIAAIVDELGRRTEMEYDLVGRLVLRRHPDLTTETFTYDPAGNRTSYTDRMGNVTHFEYDNLSRLVRTIAPDDTPGDLTDNPAAQREYDAAGRLVAEIGANGGRTDYHYDAAGQLLMLELPEVLNADIGAIFRPTFTYTYDARGLLIRTTDPAGGVTTQELDAVGRPIRTTGPDGNSVERTYDAVGRVLSQTDQLGRTTTYTYTERGDLGTVTLPAPHGSAAQPVYRYEYDEAGLLTAAIDPLGRTTRYRYDARGRFVEQELPGGQTAAFEYDDAGNLVSATDYNGEVTQHFFDVMSRLDRAVFDGGVEHTFTYDDAGNLLTAQTPEGVETFSYDERGLMLTATDLFGETITYEYDDAGNRTAIVTDNGRTEYAYDALNRLIEVIGPDSGVTGYAYNAIGNLASIVSPNGVIETRSYNDGYQLVELLQEQADGTDIASYAYTADAAGRRLAVDELDGRRVVYEYDDLNRLIGETITAPAAPAQTFTYEYDLAGNRLALTESLAGATTVYTYDDNDRLLTAATGGVTTMYTYDDNGQRLTASTDADNGTVYTWDNRGRLTRAEVTTAGATQTVDYIYDHAGTMLARTVDGEQTRLLADRNRTVSQVIEEHNAAGDLTAQSLFGLGLIQRTTDGETRHYHADAIGSARVLTDAAGDVTDAYTYDAFGNVIARVGGSDNPHQFTGERRDDATGLDYLRARHLDTATGQFISADPAAGLPRIPATLHDYAYAANNPISFADPLGEQFTLIDISASSAIQSIQSSISVISKASALCRFKSFKTVFEAFGAILEVFPFVAFNLTDIIRSSTGAPGDPGGSFGTGYTLKYENPDASKGQLEGITAKVGADLTGELKLEASFKGKDNPEVSFEITLLPTDKIAESIQFAFAVPIELITFEGCGIELGTLSLATKVAVKPFAPISGPTGGASVALKAGDAFGIAEFQFDLITVTDRGTLSIGGVPVT